VKQGYDESRFSRGAVGPGRAQGALQAKIQYWKGAWKGDHIGAGLTAIRYYQRTSGRCWWHRYTGRAKSCTLSK